MNVLCLPARADSHRRRRIFGASRPHQAAAYTAIVVECGLMDNHRRGIAPCLWVHVGRVVMAVLLPLAARYRYRYEFILPFIGV